MKKPAQNGFTLIELMVAMTIMVIMGVYVFSNYRSFGESKNLKNAVLNLQSQLREAQTNATSNVLCNITDPSPVPADEWRGFVQKDISNLNKLSTYCWFTGGNLFREKISNLPANMVIDSICGKSDGSTDCPSTASCRYVPDTADFVYVSFKPLSGEVSFYGTTGSNDYSCFISKTAFIIVVKDTKNDNTQNNTQNLIIEKGGRIYAQ